MKKALITGITGFVGSHLAELLLSNGYEVYGTVRPRSSTENIDHIKNKVKLVEIDITDPHSVLKVVGDVKPDCIFHLAAQTFVPSSWNAPTETLNVNIMGTLNILEAARKLDTDTRIQIAGSSEEYGKVYKDEVPIRETNPLRPMSPYGVSKVAADKLAVQYNMSYGLKTVVTRAFNHTGPRRGEVFATSNFAKQIAMIEKGKQEPVIAHGNMEAQRDFSDVRDVVRAYEISLQKCKFGDVYNICSGKAITIKDMLNTLLGFSKVKITTKFDESRARPSDVEVLCGDCSKFREQTGWKPSIPFEKTMEDLLNYWRKRV
jgi:GDP-4-dehydro-6-deoxy-D-mannose reductase